MRIRIAWASACVALLLAGQANSAEEKTVFIQRDMPVWKFAVECQHPAMKKYPEARQSACLSYLVGSVQQIGMTKGTEKCWDELSGFGGSPAAISDMLFHMAADPKDRDMDLALALHWVVTNVSAKNCR
jgi:hypothetical protein